MAPFVVAHGVPVAAELGDDAAAVHGAGVAWQAERSLLAPGPGAAHRDLVGERGENLDGFKPDCSAVPEGRNTPVREGDRFAGVTHELGHDAEGPEMPMGLVRAD